MRRAGEWRPERQSVGTQYSKPPSGSVTQPSVSGYKQNFGCIESEEEENGIGTCGIESVTCVVSPPDAETMCWPSREREMDIILLVCPSGG